MAMRVRGTTVDFKSEHDKPLIKSAHLAGEAAQCDCVGYDGVDMVIVWWRENDTHHVRNFPEKGGAHRADCPYFNPSRSGSGRHNIGTAISRNRDTGELEITLKTGINKRLIPAVRSIAETTDDKEISAPRSTASDIALIHALLEEAALNQYHPQQALTENRESRYIHSLKTAASRATVQGTGLWCISLFPDDATNFTAATKNRHERFIEKLKTFSDTTQPVGFIFGFFNGVIPTQEGHPDQRPFRFQVRGLEHVDIWLSFEEKKLVNESKRGFRQFHNLTRIDPTCGLFCMLRVISDSNGNLLFTSAEMQPVSSQFIPVNSELELRMANRLCSENRNFLKVLDYRARTDEPLASFTLLDTPDTAHIFLHDGRFKRYLADTQEDPIHILRTKNKNVDYLLIEPNEVYRAVLPDRVATVTQRNDPTITTHKVSIAATDISEPRNSGSQRNKKGGNHLVALTYGSFELGPRREMNHG